MGHIASYLPPELLLECLRAADPPTRVRASHVSRAWRCLALSDRRLWDSFSCTYFRNEQHQDAMLHKLQVMLLRSHPLPFRLCVPHRFHGTGDQYQHPLLSMEHLDVRRLASYDGPKYLFTALIKGRSPLPNLTFLNIIKGDCATVELSGEFSGNGFPNLRTFVARSVIFTSDSCPLPATRHLTCSLRYGDEIIRLFEVFQNLVRIQINDITPGMSFPLVSIPVSLQTIALFPAPGCELYTAWVLEHWHGLRIPRLVANAMRTVRGIIPHFLAMHAHPVRLQINKNCEIEISAPPDDPTPAFTWTMTPSSTWHSTFLEGLETRGCERLVSICVALDVLTSVFAAPLHVPGLERLELRLDGSQHPPPLQASDERAALRAPPLQHVVFTICGRVDAIRARVDGVRGFLVVLRASFRAVIVYDALLLESFTLSAPAACMQTLQCASFAHLAKNYRFCATVE